MDVEATLLLGAAFAAGAVFCFLGYHTFRLVAGLTGFGAGFGLGFYIFHRPFAQVGGLAAGFVMGMSGAALAFFFYPLLVFCLGAVLLAWPALAGAYYLQLPGEVPLIAAGAAGAVGGLLALMLRKQLVIAGTANLGALLIAFSVFCLADKRLQGWQVQSSFIELLKGTVAKGPPVVFALAAWVSLLLAGVAVQSFWTGRSGWLDEVGQSGQ